MKMPKSIFDNAEAEIRAMVSPFCDTGTELSIRPDTATSIAVSGRKDFIDFALNIDVASSNDSIVLFSINKAGVKVPLPAALCQHPFANLDLLARSIEETLNRRVGKAEVSFENLFIRHDGHTSEMPAEKAIHRALTPGDDGTKLTFLHGQAGAGKSWALMNAALIQARNYLLRKADRLYLYVDAQGVALNTLEQQLARQLDIYNGVLTFRVVVPLVKMGKLSIIVDGFDELIMPSGFQEVLGQLYGYLQEFEGRGAMIASSRTSFFRTYELSSEVTGTYPSVKSEFLELSPWTNQQWSEYCESHGDSSAATTLAAVAKKDATAKELLGRPFVVAQVFKLLSQGKSLKGRSLFSLIEDAYTERERCEKLVDVRSSSPRPILTKDQFNLLLQEVALEMWRLRQTSLDITTLKTLTELLVADWKLAPKIQQTLIERIDTNSFLEFAPGLRSEKRVQFPHDVIFGRLLAHSIARNLSGGKVQDLLDILGVSPLPESVAEHLLDVLDGSDSNRQSKKSPAAEALQKITEVSRHIKITDNRGWNSRVGLATCATALMRGLKQTNIILSFSNLYFQSLRLQDIPALSISFDNTIFELLDARNGHAEKLSFAENCEISELLISDGQKLNASLPRTNKLLVYHGGESPRATYGPAAIRNVVFGTPVEETRALGRDAREMAEILEKFLHHRDFWFSRIQEDKDSPTLMAIKRKSTWPYLLKLLDDHGLLSRSVRQRSGTIAELFHIRGLEEILAGRDRDAKVSPQVYEFWRDLSKPGKA